jgi:plastocyanin
MTLAGTRNRWPVAVVAAAAVLVLASCGGGGGGGSQGYRPPKGAATETISIAASNFQFVPDHVDAKAGIANIQLVGKGGIHTLVFDKNKVPGFQLEVSGSGDQQSEKVDLKPGTYTFYCNVDGHRQLGMQGTITVS